jgi:hypothetical protein
MLRGVFTAFATAVLFVLALWASTIGASSWYRGPEYFPAALTALFVGLAAGPAALAETYLARRKLTLRRNFEVFLFVGLVAYIATAFMAFNLAYMFECFNYGWFSGEAVERAMREAFGPPVLLLLIPLAIPQGALAVARLRANTITRRWELTALLTLLPAFFGTFVFRGSGPDAYLGGVYWPAVAVYCCLVVLAAEAADRLERRVTARLEAREDAGTRCACDEIDGTVYFVPLRGLNCAGCELQAGRLLSPIDGVYQVHASRSLNGAHVVVVPARLVKLSEIGRALAASHFTVDEDRGLHGNVNVLTTPPAADTTPDVTKIAAALGSLTGLAAPATAHTVSFPMRLGHDGATSVKKVRETVEQAGHAFADIELRADASL